MDLGNCPQCGEEWVSGYERCMKCGYVAIGAGLKDLKPKKQKKKKKGKYREPGASAPFLAWTAGLLLMGCGYEYEPWKNDWEMVRVLMGEERSPDISGVWEIKKDINLEAGGLEVSPEDSLSGTVEFRDFKFAMKVNRKGTPIIIKGEYKQHANRLYFSKIKATGPGVKDFPATLDLTTEKIDETQLYLAIGNSEGLLLQQLKDAVPHEIEHQGWRAKFQ